MSTWKFLASISLTINELIVAYNVSYLYIQMLVLVAWSNGNARDSFTRTAIGGGVCVAFAQCIISLLTLPLICDLRKLADGNNFDVIVAKCY